METEEIKSDIEGLIQELMAKEGVDKYQLFFQGKSEIGDNYGGEILFLKVQPENGEKPYELVAKTAKRAVEIRKWVPVDMIYNRELFIYSKVFPIFRNLIEETKSGLKFDFIPKVYSISDIPYKQTIIFENLKTQGFKLHNRKEPWNLEHSLLAMKEYGEFHALSMALRDQKPEVFKDLVSQMPNIQTEFNKCFDIRSFVCEPLKKVMEMLEKRGKSDLVQKYTGFVDEVEAIMDHQVEEESERIVIGHTDCWNNNFMFKYQNDDETKPTSIRFLDFQLSIASSPIRDLSYNIYTTCDKSSLDHFDKILETYYASLSRCLVRLGSKPEEILSFEELKKQWKKYGKFGLITALLVLKICLIEKEDAPDFGDISKTAENVEAFTEAFDIAIKNPEEYNRRVLEVFIHYGENFL